MTSQMKDSQSFPDLSELSLVHNGHLKKLKHAIQSDSSLNSYRFPDSFLLTFILCKEGNIDKAHRRLRLYVKKVRENLNLFGKNIDPKQSAFESRFLQVFREPTINGKSIFLFKAGFWNPKETSVDECILTLAYLQAALVRSQVKGAHLITDASNLSCYHFYSVGPKKLRTVAEIVTNMLPLRIEKIHLINVNRVLILAFRAIQPFLGKKIRSRVAFHGDNLVDDLSECCSPAAVALSFNDPPDTCMMSIQELMELSANGRDMLVKVWQQIVKKNSLH
ncbi:alpha-tocopherol transfer protein-like [Brevipalpus obovatus]|uniref:alpha-tocopherol transfer protein-like n=1 Tax=Brevipalpus obovatus TaxID=246614 RepID=UPI003D9DFE3B